MFGIGWKISAVMAAIALGAGAWGAWEATKAHRATVRAVMAERAVDALERTLKAERRAAEVLAAERDRFEARADEYDAMREALLEGGDDADIPSWMRDFLDGLFPGNGTGGANGSE